MKIDVIRTLPVLSFHAVDSKKERQTVVDVPGGCQAAVEYEFLADFGLRVIDHQRVADSIAASEIATERKRKILGQGEIRIHVHADPAAGTCHESDLECFFVTRPASNDVHSTADRIATVQCSLWSA